MFVVFRLFFLGFLRFLKPTGHFPDISRNWTCPADFLNISKKISEHVPEKCGMPTPDSMNSLFSEFFGKFGGVVLEVCETI